MILIASGAYLQGEFASEVGLLPPSFLPIGNQRLYEYQVQLLKEWNESAEDLYLSVPSSYEIDVYDQGRLAALGVQVLEVPDGLSLSDSLLYCWNATAKHHNELTILHGDTLFINGVFNGGDAISVHPNRGFYKRATLGQEVRSLELVHDEWSNDCDQVVSGFFRFENPLFFMKSLVESRSDFVQAIVSYHQEYPVELITNGDWLDFGHINSFYHSRTRMTTQRAFNDLNIGLRSVSKTSKKRSKKIYAEGSWFANLPLPLRLYTPALLGLDMGGKGYRNANYQLEYLYQLPLSDLFVFSRIAKGCWQTIFNCLSSMLSDFSRFRPEEVEQTTLDEINSLYLPKTIDRLEEYARQSAFDIQAPVCFVGEDAYSLVEVAKLSSNYIQPATERDVAIVHGDLCFSNILFDSRVEAVKCIDPRGITPSGKLSLYGDRRYDLAKLYHSVVGLYDLIIAGHFSLQKNKNMDFEISFSKNQKLHLEMIDSFREMVLKPQGYDEKEILGITVHLFLSMLPLHADRPERQQAFIANALRLFKLLRELS
ncbi:hypothetical protein [Thiomicrorhabdus xiamenensis]|uniref:Capsular biosynthesis protein n=1 Tax=Thiomicrorhabdus xiamenensis TaxID=2739063 RepID=A0A7D4SIL6_9GAMM|nr:hypothetical protein [Thiomicrorhabdus xiamenensis]QKI89780.1 hypothetical protein HQN79_09440 [Thiomicrorhabdus xiamenensis]